MASRAIPVTFERMQARTAPRRWAAVVLVSAAGSGGLAATTAVAQEADTQAPEVIVVTSSIIPQPRRQIGTAVSVVDSGAIERRGYHDVFEVLRTEPGIGVSNSGGPGKATSLRIRGEEHFRTLLMIDGVKALDPGSPQVAPSFDVLLTTGDLERIEILRGPQGFIYGADAGGVVNVLTKRGGDELSGQLGLEYGDYATRKIDAAIAGGGERGDYFVSVGDLATDGFNSQTADTLLRDDDGADNTTLHAKLGLNLSDGLRVQLVARDIDAATAYDGCFSPVTFALVHACNAATQQQIYKLSADYASGGSSHAFGYGYSAIARDNFTAGAPAFATDAELGRLEYTGTYEPSAALTLVYGVDLQEEQLVADDGVRSRDQQGYYAEYQGAFAQRLFVTLGARYDDNDDFGAHTSTRLSAAYLQDLAASRSLKYRASVGTGFRAPSLYEVAYNAGPFASFPAAGFALAEEQSAGYDLGLEYTGTNGWRAEVTFFDQDIEDEIFFDLAGFSGYLQSRGTSTSKGVELAIAVPLAERWQLSTNWTHNRAEDSTDEQRLRRPKNLGNVALLYRAADERFTLLANYRVSKDSLDIGAVALPDYAVLDLSASYDLSGALEIYGRMHNATDEHYEEVLGHAVAARSVYGGVRLRF